MFKGIKLVAIVMAVMVIIGTMMVPAHADYERTATFEEKFEVLFDLYLEREGLEDYFVIDSIEYEETDRFNYHLIRIGFTDIAIEEIKGSEGIESDDVYIDAHLSIFDNLQYNLVATLYVDGEIYDGEFDWGTNVLEDFDLI